MPPHKQYEFKVVVLGDKSVGKTCLVLRFIEGYFAAKQQSTIGAFFLAKTFTLPNGVQCKMQLWDTAGQERFRAMAPMYYRGAACAIVCFDITHEESFTKMKDWVEELKQNVSDEDFILAIACNKTDLESERVVSKSRAEGFAAKNNALLFETSAKENIGVEELFKKVSEEIVLKLGGTQDDGGTGASDRPASQVIGRPSSMPGNSVLGGGAVPTKTSKKKDSGCC